MTKSVFMFLPEAGKKSKSKKVLETILKVSKAGPQVVQPEDRFRLPKIQKKSQASLADFLIYVTFHSFQFQCFSSISFSYTTLRSYFHTNGARRKAGCTKLCTLSSPFIKLCRKTPLWSWKMLVKVQYQAQTPAIGLHSEMKTIKRIRTQTQL